MKPDLSDAALRKFRDNQEIIRQTAEQIIKDFALFGISISFPADMNFAYLDLYHQLHEHISHMWDTNNNTLVSLLYRIDLQERSIWKKKEEYPDIPVTEIITELTLERELKKILTRRFYSETRNTDLDSLTS